MPTSSRWEMKKAVGGTNTSFVEYELSLSHVVGGAHPSN
jgi:hypothetical protein